MYLTNCYSSAEKSLKRIDLESLNNKELVRLAQHVRGSYIDGVYKDESLVIDALTQISERIGGRYSK